VDIILSIILHPQNGFAIFLGPARKARSHRPKMANVNPKRNKSEKKVINTKATRKVHNRICNRKKKKGKTALESKKKNFGYRAESRQLADDLGLRIKNPFYELH
jgi:hypothetical protein